MHHFIRAADIKPTPAFPKHAAGYRRFALSDRSVGAVHTGWGLCELDAGGRVDLHVQSFEKSFFVLSGNPALILDGRGYRLSAGACGLIPVGMKHAWLGPTSGTAQVDRHERAVPEGREFRRRHVLPRPAAAGRDRGLRHSRPLVAAPVPHGRGRHQGRLRAQGLEERRREGVGEHGDRPARLQRHLAEDARRPTARRGAAHDVHGRVRAERERASARPPARRGLLRHARRGRGVGRRAEVPHASPATSSGPASAAHTRSTIAATGRCVGSRLSRRSRRRATRTVGPATGNTFRSNSSARESPDEQR